MALVHQSSDVELNGNIDNVDFDGDDVRVLPGDDGFQLRSMGPNGVTDGTEIVVCNVSDEFSFTLPHAHANGTAGGQFFFPDGTDGALSPFEEVWGVWRDKAGRTGWWMNF